MIGLCVLVAAGFVFHTGFALKQKRTYTRSVASLAAQEQAYERLLESNRQKKREWLRWDQARRDVVAVEAEYLYREDKDVNLLRKDLQDIFRAAGVQAASELKFDYAEIEREKLRRVGVSFTITGRYFSLKKLLHQVENHPRFLMVERVDFVDIDSRTGRLELRIELAGYYES